MISNLSIVFGAALFIAFADSDEFKCTEPGLFSLPMTNCKSYYVCSAISDVDYVASTQTCDDGLVFDENQKKCVPQNVYACPDTDPCHNQTGRFPISNTNCSSYYFCVKRGNGAVKTIYNCPFGSKFSPISRRCERAYKCSIPDATTTITENAVTSNKTTTTSVPSSSEETSTISVSTPPNEATTTNSATEKTTNSTTSEETTATTDPSNETSTISISTPPDEATTTSATISTPSEETTHANSTSIEPSENTIETNSTTESSTASSPSATTTSESITSSWETGDESISPTTEQTTSENNVITTELPKTSTVPSSTTISVTSEAIVIIPSAPANSMQCPAKCIMCTKTGHYKVVGDVTSYVSCVRLDAMLFCGINKCENGTVFCETSNRCIDRIQINN